MGLFDRLLRRQPDAEPADAIIDAPSLKCMEEIAGVILGADSAARKQAASVLNPQKTFYNAWLDLVNLVFCRKDLSGTCPQDAFIQISRPDERLEGFLEKLGWLFQVRAVPAAFDGSVFFDNHNIRVWGAVADEQLAARGLCLRQFYNGSKDYAYSIVPLEEGMRLLELARPLTKIFQSKTSGWALITPFK